MPQDMSDVPIFVDSKNIHHAFQPLRALSAERLEYLVTLARAMTQYFAMPQIHDNPELEDAEAKLTLAALQTLLPTVNTDELERLDLDTRRAYLLAWDKLQPRPTLTPAA